MYKLDLGLELYIVFFNFWSIRKKVIEDRVEEMGVRNREIEERIVSMIEMIEIIEDSIEEREDRLMF